MNFFRLNRLNPVARGVRDRAKLMTLSDVAVRSRRCRLAGRASTARWPTPPCPAWTRRLAVARARSHRGVELMADEMVKVGLTVVAAYETERCFIMLQRPDRRSPDRRSRCCGWRSRSVKRCGFPAAAAMSLPLKRSLDFSLGFRFALRLQRSDCVMSGPSPMRWPIASNS